MLGCDKWVAELSGGYFRALWKFRFARGRDLGALSEVFSAVVEIHFCAFRNCFWPKTGIWAVLIPRGPPSSHLDEMSENVNFP